MTTSMRKVVLFFCILASGGVSVACGDDKGDDDDSGPDQGNMSASSAADSVGGINLTITAGNGASGLFPGTNVENIADGWKINHEKFLVMLRDVSAQRGGTTESITSERIGILVDLTRVIEPAGVMSLVVAPGAFDSAEFSLRPADGDTALIRSDETDSRLMADNGYAIYIRGSMTKPKGQSCTPGGPAECEPALEIQFEWGISGERRFTGCNGFMVTRDETTDVSLTLPGDRWFLSDFTADADLVPRRAQWIADADLDHDGTTTLDELRSIPAAELFTKENGYDLGGSPIPVETAYDFLQAQIYTIGLDPANGCTRSLSF